MKRIVWAWALALISALGGATAAETIGIDVAADRRPIDPRIYGVSWGGRAQVAELRCVLNRLGGNAATRYNWKQNASNRGSDWYFESIADGDAVTGAMVDGFVADAHAAGVDAMVTIPMIGRVARLGPGRGKLASYSQARYGAQTGNDWQWFPDAGNGILAADGQRIAWNDPDDANVAVDVAFMQDWVRHLVGRWGTSAAGGVRHYVLDNEPGLWHETHRDVRPVGVRMAELRDALVAHARAIKAVDAGAVTHGPELWGWTAYLHSGYDAQWGAAHGWSDLPDRRDNGGWDQLPWLLDQLRQASQAEGRRLLDVCTVHWYPQGGEFSNDVSVAMQRRRNRSTRSLWDPGYVDETWIGTPVRLIPRLRGWVDQHYPGTAIGLTEYSWGADGHMNGATAQADILGILGREGLDVANRWVMPETGTPVYRAMQLYRNHDGRGGAFGGTSVRCTAPDPDRCSAFAALRADGALTVMIVAKELSGTLDVDLAIGGFAPGATAQAWQVTGGSPIARLADLAVSGGHVRAALPQPSVTLVVVPPAAGQPPTIARAAAATPHPVTGTTAACSVLGADDGGEAALTYTWSASGPAAVAFSPDGGNAAKDTTATFAAAGAYVITATIRDGQGRTATSSAAVTVTQTPAAVRLAP